VVFTKSLFELLIYIIIATCFRYLIYLFHFAVASTSELGSIAEKELGSIVEKE